MFPLIWLSFQCLASAIKPFLYFRFPLLMLFSSSAESFLMILTWPTSCFTISSFTIPVYSFSMIFFDNYLFSVVDSKKQVFMDFSMSFITSQIVWLSLFFKFSKNFSRSLSKIFILSSKSCRFERLGVFSFFECEDLYLRGVQGTLLGVFALDRLFQELLFAILRGSYAECIQLLSSQWLHCQMLFPFLIEGLEPKGNLTNCLLETLLINASVLELRCDDWL